MKTYLGNDYSDEWYTDKSIVELVYKYLKIPFENKIVMCPCDKAWSKFVEVAKEHSPKNVIYGITDFLENDYEYDVLFTNPPFSLKDAFIEKVLKDGKPSALILPLSSIGGQKRRKLFEKYSFPHIIMPNKRISFTDENGVKRKASNFDSVFLIFNTEKHDIEYVNI